MVRAVYQADTGGGQLTLSEQTAMTCMETMMTARRDRNKILHPPVPIFSEQAKAMDAFQNSPQRSFNLPTTSQAVLTTTEDEAPGKEGALPRPADEFEIARDAGDSDAVWLQL